MHHLNRSHTCTADYGYCILFLNNVNLDLVKVRTYIHEKLTSVFMPKASDKAAQIIKTMSVVS